MHPAKLPTSIAVAHRRKLKEVQLKERRSLIRRHARADFHQSRLPWLFGRGGRDRALVCLAINGPLTVRELARATKTDPHKMWDMIERLRLSGLVVKREMPGGRKYVSINRRLPIYRTLMNLLIALDGLSPTLRCSAYTARWRMPFDRELTDERLDNIFQSPLRSRILLFVATVGEPDMQTIYTSLGLGTVSTTLAVNHWQKQGVLRSQTYKRHRLVSLDPNFVVAPQLLALLRAIIATADEYKALRAATRRKPLFRTARGQ